MDPSSSHTLQTDDETRVLGALLEAFHPFLSLQEIASAYCRAGNDLYKASEILCQLKESNTNIVHHENDNGMKTTQSEESVCGDNTKDSSYSCNNKILKPKKQSATIGTVSTILGKSYARPTSTKKEMVEATKPLKLEVKGSSADELETGYVKIEEHSDHRDMEEFLFSMLGDGFKLSKDVIREVLGQCGYDVKKTVEELFALSAETPDMGKRINCDISENLSLNTGKLLNSERCVEEIDKQSPHTVRKATEPTSLDKAGRKAADPTSLDKERSDLPRELLVALFSAPDICEEEPKKRLEWGLNRTRVVGQKVVTKPLDDIVSKPLSEEPDTQSKYENDEDDAYWMLRREAKEHWDKMKECYGAAVEAYASGDISKADDLLEQGRHHNRMAREADEKSAVQILETKKSDTHNDIPLDLHSHTAKESICLLKKHLVSLANIPMFRYLKVIVNTDAEDTTKGKRKRLVIKLLERESIKWSEEDGKPGTILVELNGIDPSKLTFAK